MPLMDTDNKPQMNPIRNYMIEQRKIVIDEIDNKTTEISNRVKHRWNFISLYFLSVYISGISLRGFSWFFQYSQI